MKELFSLRTVRKKIIMISKAAGLFLIVSYIISTRLPFVQDISFLIWTAFVILLVFAVDYLLGHFISDPVAKICGAAHQIAELDFSSPCEVSSEDEFGVLARDLNKMSGKLQHTLQELEHVNAQLEKDIQQERLLLQERKELIDRLSHEMKTPLGVIRAFAEGIQDETDESTKQKYSEIIISETERMSTLITTLLDLSALENGAAQLMPESFGFVEFLETIAGRLLIDIPEPHFELQYELPEQETYVYADKQRMEQVLNNLIVNAEKNVSSNGMIRLSLIRRDGKLCFSIFNQGKPIPEEKLPRIWEKFYRDKNAGYRGSGLGLAIAAQVLSMHDIEYGVKNLPDGVEFYFFIPIAE